MLCAIAAAACAPSRPALPTGPGAPAADFQPAWSDATRACSGVTTLTASLSLSGKVGRTKMRGRVDAGFAAPASVRLEGVAPFGRPVFVLVGVGDRGTLVLPRDNRVLRDAPLDQIVDALAGVPLGAADLRAVVSGCGLTTEAAPREARTYPGGWLAVDMETAGTVFLRRAGSAWRVAAASRPPISVRYDRDPGGRVTLIQLRTDTTGATADLRLRLSEVDVNVTLDPRTFAVDVPPDAAPLTIDDLRRAGPLGAR